MIILRFVDYILYTYFGGMVPDARTKDLFPANNAGFWITCSTLYLLIVFFGPGIMNSMKAFEIKRIIMTYNASMIVANAYVVYLAATGGWFTHYKFICQPPGSIDDPQSHQMALAQYCYLLTKFAELLDTVFFILRKKSRQVSFLHVYHHVSVLAMVWVATRYLPDGHGSLMTLINSGIHVIMYTYYLLCLFGPEMQKYLWWKQYLTRMQLTQFVVVILHSMWVLHPDCPYPTVMMSSFTANIIIYVVLFTDFYTKNYSGVKNELKKTEKNLATMCYPTGQPIKQE